MAPSRWEQAQFYLFALYVLGVTVPVKTLQWLIRGPRPLSWSLRTTLYVHLMKSFASKEGLGWQAPLPPVPPLEVAEASEPILFVKGPIEETAATPYPASGEARAKESTPKIDEKGYTTTGITIPYEPHASILGPPIHPYSHTYADPKSGAKRTVEVKPKPVRAFWLEAPGALEGDRTRGQGRVVLAMHGGGYVGGWPTFPNFYRLSRRGRFPVLSVKYRLGTKHHSRYPAPIQDAVIAYSYLLRECGYPPSAITFIGDSAGGGLAAALMLYLTARGLPLPGKLVLLSPWVDLTSHYPSIHASPVDYLAPMNFYWGARRYVRGDEELLETPLVSPERADWKAVGKRVRKDGRQWPETFVTWGELETLADESSALARKMREEAGFGHRIRDLGFKDMIHDFTFLPVAEGTDLRSLIVDFILDQWSETKATKFRAKPGVKSKL